MCSSECKRGHAGFFKKVPFRLQKDKYFWPNSDELFCIAEIELKLRFNPFK